MSIMASAEPQSTTTPNLPLVGFVAVTLPADGPALRSTWIDQHVLIVGFDPARLTRNLAALIVHRTVGAYEDIDGGEQP